MIQKGTILNVVDNSGAKKVSCIHLCQGYQRRYARVGDIIIASVKSVRSKRREKAKINKGDVVRALVVKTKALSSSYSGDKLSFFENSVILLNNQNKILGTRVFSPIMKSFRYTKYLRLLSLGSGIIK